MTDSGDFRNDDNFQYQWFKHDFQPPRGKVKKSPVQQNLENIKQYAYDAFDKLDTNGNGFIERDELMAAFEDENVPMKDKSYIMFLLNNQKEIADSARESAGDQEEGISRVDLDMYFKLVLSRLGF